MGTQQTKSLRFFFFSRKNSHHFLTILPKFHDFLMTLLLYLKNCSFWQRSYGITASESLRNIFYLLQKKFPSYPFQISRLFYEQFLMYLMFFVTQILWDRSRKNLRFFSFVLEKNPYHIITILHKFHDFLVNSSYCSPL